VSPPFSPLVRNSAVGFLSVCCAPASPEALSLLNVATFFREREFTFHPPRSPEEMYFFQAAAGSVREHISLSEASTTVANAVSLSSYSYMP